MEFSPSSEASSSSRSLEEDEGREDNSSIEYCKEEEENGEMVDMEEVLGNTEGEGKEKGGDISAGEQVDEGRESKKVREKTVGNQLFDQQREEGNLQERIAAMKNTLQEFQELKTAYKWVNNYRWLVKICCFFFDDDDYHGHIMGTIATNDIVYYPATPITQKNANRYDNWWWLFFSDQNGLDLWLHSRFILLLVEPKWDSKIVFG